MGSRRRAAARSVVMIVVGTVIIVGVAVIAGYVDDLAILTVGA